MNTHIKVRVRKRNWVRNFNWLWWIESGREIMGIFPGTMFPWNFRRRPKRH